MCHFLLLHVLSPLHATSRMRQHPSSVAGRSQETVQARRINSVEGVVPIVRVSPPSVPYLPHHTSHLHVYGFTSSRPTSPLPFTHSYPVHRLNPSV